MSLLIPKNIFFGLLFLGFTNVFIVFDIIWFFIRMLELDAVASSSLTISYFLAFLERNSAFLKVKNKNAREEGLILLIIAEWLAAKKSNWMATVLVKGRCIH